MRSGRPARTLMVAMLLAAAGVLVTCRGRGCPRRHPKMTAVGHRGLHHLLKSLSGRRYRVGETLDIRMSAPGWRDEGASVVFRDGRKPRLLRLRR